MHTISTVKGLFGKFITPAMNGFKLNITNNSFVYTRTEKESIQQIEFVLRISTNDDKIVYFKIYPRINVYFKKVNDLAEIFFNKYISENYLDSTVDCSTYSAPVGNTYKFIRNNRQIKNMDTDDFSEETKHIGQIVSEKALPMLEKLKNTDDLISCWENNLLMYPHRIAVYVVSAYMLKGNKEKAIETAEKYIKNSCSPTDPKLFDKPADK